MKDLLSLIKALTPIEKQHFKKRHNSNSDFVLLFDYINKKKLVETSEVLDYLNSQSSKTYNSSYLSVTKSYLKNKILESLRIQSVHKKRNYELLSKAINTDILIEKGLFSLASKELEKSTDEYLDISFPIERLLLLRRRSLLHYFENYNNATIESIESLFSDRLKSAEQLVLEIKFSRILSILSYEYFHGENDTDLLQSFMDEPYMKDESLSMDFSTKYLFHWVHAQFQEFKSNPEGAQLHFNKSIKVWLENEKYIDAHPKMYLGACFTYFKYLLHQKNPFSNILDDINYEVLMSKVKAEKLGAVEENKQLFLFTLFEIMSLRHKNEFSKMLDLVNPFLVQTEFVESLPSYERVVFYYYASLANFELGNYQRALDILIDIIVPVDSVLSKNPVYITVFVMLYLLILFESGNEKYLRIQLNKGKKYLQNENRLSAFETHFINMLSQLITPRYKDSLDTVYSRFHDRLVHAHKGNTKGIDIEYSYFIIWAKKKELELL